MRKVTKVRDQVLPEMIWLVCKWWQDNSAGKCAGAAQGLGYLPGRKQIRAVQSPASGSWLGPWQLGGVGAGRVWLLSRGLLRPGLRCRLQPRAGHRGGRGLQGFALPSCVVVPTVCVPYGLQQLPLIIVLLTIIYCNLGFPDNAAK